MNPTNVELEAAIDKLHAEMGLKRLHPGWAKLEIFLGLTGAGIGIYLLGFGWHAGGSECSWKDLGEGLFLFVSGWYLALAGTRSHLYQSNNRAVAYLSLLVEKSRFGAEVKGS